MGKYSVHIRENMLAKNMSVDEFEKLSQLPSAIVKALQEDRCVVDGYIAKRIAKAFGQCWKVWLKLYENMGKNKLK